MFVNEEAKIVSSKPSISWVSTDLLEDRIDSFTFKDYIIENDKLFSSMNNVVELKDLLVKNHRGKGLTSNPNGKIPNLKVRNITNNGINLEDVDLIDENEFEKNKTAHVKKGDVLLAVTGVGSLGKVDLYWSEKKATVDGHVNILRTNEKCDSGYLRSFLHSKYGQIFIQKYTIGSTGQTELYSSDIAKFKIYLPNMNIQQYIGNKVRKAEELREEAKQLMSQVYELINIHFSLDSFENEIKDNYKYDFVSSNYLEDRLDAEYYDPNLIKLFTHLSKMGFKFVNLGNVSRMVFTGENVESTWIAPNKKVPLIYIGNLEGYFVIPSDSEFIDENNVRNWEKSFAEFGDILFASRGSLDCLINRISVYFDEDKKGVITSNIIAVRLDQNLIRPGYVISVLKSIIGTYQIT